eukprot:CAMPEP_0172727852 /NCGR_PEP_ID=MMETSP1074-20121228/91907_1 /TAXON_ID=2916 /ORGANISM="Ceratium fusus, Strain PA161109" /LENGTH=218 /DNA_ID=CAMNT_0013555033 /DNA_START=190 /DNA_END=846 /DNA_ORIENTATION=+
MAAYHSSIVLGDKEYYFDGGGIQTAPICQSHMIVQGVLLDPHLETQSFGNVVLTGDALKKGLGVFFRPGTYDIIFKNCNAFTDAAIYFLCRQRLRAKYSRLERFLMATKPASLSLLNGMIKRGQQLAHPETEGTQVWAYEANPLAQGFSVDEVVAACDLLDGGTLPPSHPNAVCQCSGLGFMGCNVCCERAAAQRLSSQVDSPRVSREDASSEVQVPA